MSPEAARHRAALRLAFAATLALVWGTMAGEPLPGLTAVLAAQILVGMPRPPRLGQAATLVAVIAATGGAAFAVAMIFADRPLTPDRRARVAVLPRFCDARTGSGPALAPRDHVAERHRGGPGPHGPSGHSGGRRTRRPSSPRRYGRCSSSGFSTRSSRHRQEETATGAAAGAAAATGMPVRTQRRGAYPRQGRHRAAGTTLLPRRAHSARLPGAARARHLPVRAGSDSRAHPTRDPAAGQPRRKRRRRRRLGGLGDRSAAARADADGAARLPGLRSDGS